MQVLSCGVLVALSTSHRLSRHTQHDSRRGHRHRAAHSTKLNNRLRLLHSPPTTPKPYRHFYTQNTSDSRIPPFAARRQSIALTVFSIPPCKLLCAITFLLCMNTSDCFCKSTTFCPFPPQILSECRTSTKELSLYLSLVRL